MTEMASKPVALWKKGRGPIIANLRMVELANAINQLLVEPIGILPASPEQALKPFAIGISPLIEARLKPDASRPDLKAAIRRFARHRFYLLAVAQPNAMRHDIDGNPIEPVSDNDRLAAQMAYGIAMDTMAKRRKEGEEIKTAA